MYMFTVNTPGKTPYSCFLFGLRRVYGARGPGFFDFCLGTNCAGKGWKGASLCVCTIYPVDAFDVYAVPVLILRGVSNLSYFWMSPWRNSNTRLRCLGL
jgi:hypothetical protein